MDKIGGSVIAVVTGIITLAVVAVIFSQRAQTPAVLQSGGSALASVIGAAVSPVSGASVGGTASSLLNTFGAVAQGGGLPFG